MGLSCGCHRTQRHRPGSMLSAFSDQSHVGLQWCHPAIGHDARRNQGQLTSACAVIKPPHLDLAQQVPGFACEEAETWLAVRSLVPSKSACPTELSSNDYVDFTDFSTP